ncbi:LacI family DNA-binding transcriptional regulator [Dermatophilus congolensis]|uniref:LacI family DNA-binding transcriptional regulator n=1 Tax=Dermatophilus congolensis TaxID=1863 RepID=UPI00312C7C7E
MVTVTLRDVAQRAGVAPSTASRALDPQRPASTEVRKRVHAAAKELGYRGNGFARSLRTNKSGIIGLLIPDVRNPFFTALAYEAEQAAAAAGLAVMIGNADEDTTAQERYLTALDRAHVDGLLLVPQGQATPALHEAVTLRPTVCLDRDAKLDAPLITSDSTGGMANLIDHIVSLGHQHIAIISGPLQTSTGIERLTAAKNRLNHHGLTIHNKDIIEGDFQFASGVHAAEQLLTRPNRPDVIIAADVLMATGLITVTNRHGLRAGTDIGIAAFDDDPWFELLEVPITAIAQDIPTLAQKAVTTLINAMNNHHTTTTPIPTRLVKRSSLGERPSTPTHLPKRGEQPQENHHG